MRPVWILALNTYREVIRDRILYALLMFAFLLIGLSLALGQLSFAEQARISANFGMTAIHLCSVVLAIFVGSNLVYKEIEKKTIMTILVRPISRLQFILGKACGLTMVIITMIFGLACIMALVFLGVGKAVDARFVVVLSGLLAESLVLLGVTILFSMITKPLLVVCFSVGVFLIGHWQGSLEYFAKKDQAGALKPIAWMVGHFLPNFERVNWKDLILYYDQPIELAAKFAALGNAAAWFALCIWIATLLFMRKDVG